MDESLKDLPLADKSKNPEHSGKFDPVENPSHYASGSLECKDWIRYFLTPEEYKGWLKGSALKYIWRFEDKGKPEQDIRKAQRFLDFLVEELEREELDRQEGTEW